MQNEAALANGDNVSVNMATIKVKKMSLGMQVAYNQSDHFAASPTKPTQIKLEMPGLRQSNETLNALKMAKDTATAIE